MKTLAPLVVAIVFLAAASLSNGEDWVVHGKTYHNVTVSEVDPDVVRIMYDGGIGSLSLADLTPELQKRFNYNPEEARAAVQRKAAQAAALQEAQRSQQAKWEKKDAAHNAKRITFLNSEMAQLSDQISMLGHKIYALERSLGRAKTTVTRDRIEEDSDQSESQMQATLDDDKSKLRADQLELAQLQPDTD